MRHLFQGLKAIYRGVILSIDFFTFFIILKQPYAGCQFDIYRGVILSICFFHLFLATLYKIKRQIFVCLVSENSILLNGDQFLSIFLLLFFGWNSNLQFTVIKFSFDIVFIDMITYIETT